MIKRGRSRYFFPPFVLTVLASCMLYSLFPHLFASPTPRSTHTHTHTHTKLHKPSPTSPPPPFDGLAAYPHYLDGRSGQY